VSTRDVPASRDDHLPHHVAIAATLAVLGALDAATTVFVLTRPGQHVARESNALLVALSGGNAVTVAVISLAGTWAVAGALWAWRPGPVSSEVSWVIAAGVGLRAYGVLVNLSYLLAWLQTSR
jgi:hypothetical protein